VKASVHQKVVPKAFADDGDAEEEHHPGRLGEGPGPEHRRSMIGSIFVRRACAANRASSAAPATSGTTTFAWPRSRRGPGLTAALTCAGRTCRGRPGDRFVYLSWGELDAAGTFTMFRRAKLMLAAVPPEVLSAVAQPGWRLVGRLGLTACDGMPVCAAVRPPLITWTGQGPGSES
jgi:hypothetical protein